MEDWQKNALISVYHKDGIVEFARVLIKLGWRLLASGGTAKKLAEAKISVRDVAELVGGGAILGHRVVTLSRELHAGLLARPTFDDQRELERKNLPFIGLVCADFYPLKEAIAKPDATIDSVVEMTDIGGPCLVRSAAKGGRIVISDPKDRGWVLEKLKANGDLPPADYQRLRAKAEKLVAAYILDSARYHGQGEFEGLIGQQVTTCKYGENPYATPASLYALSTEDPLALDQFRLIEGTSPSFMNYTDLDRLLQTITHIAAGFEVNFGRVPPIAIGVKHGNPCGTAVGSDPAEVMKKMLLSDPEAIFGGLVMVNFELTADLAEILSINPKGNGRLILDGVICPNISSEAVGKLKRKNNKCRVLVNPALASLSGASLDQERRIRPVRGGFLAQPNYTYVLDLKDPRLEISDEKAKSIDQLPEETAEDLVLAWAIGATSNSNTTTLVKDGQLIGNGVGQMSRVRSCELALKKAADAGHDSSNGVAYTDSFFPFDDGPRVLARGGIKTIFSSSGSIRDEETRKCCQDRGVLLIQLPDTVCRGFFNH